MTDAIPAPAASEHVLRLVDHIEGRRKNAKSLPLVVKQLQAYCGEIRSENEALERRVAQLEERLRRERSARVVADRANAAKDHALVTVAHELKGPVGAAALWARLLRRDSLSKEQREAVDMIARSLDEEMSLIDDLLDASRVARGRLRVEREPVDLVEAVRSAVELLRPVATEKGVDLAVYIDDPVPQISGDQRRIQQVVRNLVHNAIKFTPRGAWVLVRLEPAGGQVRLRVADGGRGIDPGFLPDLFKPFAQWADAGHCTGMGLGLSIASNVVSAHGGSITAASEGEGRGATFTVLLPVRGGPPAMAQAAPPSRYAPEPQPEAMRSTCCPRHGSPRSQSRIGKPHGIAFHEQPAAGN